MKRIGYVWEEVVALENCEAAILSAIKRKRKTRFLYHVKDNYKEFGEKLQQTLIDGWEPDPIRTKTINEGTQSGEICGSHRCGIISYIRQLLAF